MNIKQILLSGSLSSLLLTSASAIERPAGSIAIAPNDQQKQEKPDAPKEGVIVGSAGIIEAAPADKPQENLNELKAKDAIPAEPKPWLGIAGKSIDEAMSHQLGIKQGVIIDLVAPAGPAANAGIGKHDIITKIGDVEVANMEELRATVQKLKPNQQLDFEVLSRGKKENRKVTIGERPAGLPEFGQQPQIHMLQGQALPKELLKDLPADQRKLVEGLMAKQLEQLGKGFAGGELPLNAGELHLKNANPAAGANGRIELNFGEMMKNGNAQVAGSITMMDDKGTISMRMKNNAKDVEVKDKEGKLLYSGPYETDVDKAAVPDDIRKRIDALNFDGMQFNRIR